MKIALLGANGQLAFDLKRVLSGHEVVGFTRSDFDVTDHEAARERLSAARPDAIINTTAFHKVDLCESEPGEAFRVNSIAVFHLAGIAQALGARLVHISSDYVFDGVSVKPYSEEAIPLPISVYANSKLAGEYCVRSLCEKHIVIRTCGLFGMAGIAGKGGNFVEMMLRKAKAGEAIRVVDDQLVTPTPTADLAGQVALLLEADQYGLFHCTAEGSCSWYEFARAIFELSGLDAQLEPTNGSVLQTLARRPAYSVLDNARLNALGLNRMRHWKTGLADYLFEKHGSSIRGGGVAVSDDVGLDVDPRSRFE
jgi:dTDP-4-dehydrorhamnose reductase